MKTYQITPRTHALAKKLGVTVRPSTTKGKKIDVMKDGSKLHAIGAIGYNDYPTYLHMEEQGIVLIGTASAKQKAYKARHSSNRKVKGSTGYYADQLLWS